MKNIPNIILRILIFVTIIIVAYTFFNDNKTPFGKIKDNADLKIEIYFQSQDSILVNGNFTKSNNIVSMAGNIKSLNPTKMNAIELIFQQFDKSNMQVGQETLLINKELIKNGKIPFKKDGFTLDSKTEYLIITPKAKK